MPEDIHTFIEPELQARIVALVHGEASEFERDGLEKLMRDKPELEIYRRRMVAMHELLGDVVKPERDERWQLSEARRDLLRRTFAKQGEVVESVGKTGRRGGSRVQIRAAVGIAACLLVTVILFSLATPVALYQKRGLSSDSEYTLDLAMAGEMEMDEEGEGLGDIDRPSVRSKLVKRTPPAPAKPAGPGSNLSRGIAANTNAPEAAPMPEVAMEVPDPSADFGDGEDFGEGWGGGDGDADPFADSDDDLMSLKNGRVPDGVVRRGRGGRFEAKDVHGNGKAGLGGDLDGQIERFKRENGIDGDKSIVGYVGQDVYGQARLGVNRGNRFATYAWFRSGNTDESFLRQDLNADGLPPGDGKPSAGLYGIAGNQSGLGDSPLKWNAGFAIAYDDNVAASRKTPGRPLAKPVPSAQGLATVVAADGKVKEQLRKATDEVAVLRKKLMDAAEKTGVIWVEDAKRGRAVGGELELRELAEKQLYDVELERDQLRFQIAKLLKVEDENLPALAAELPDVGFREAFKKYEEAKSELESVKASGAGVKHPSVVKKEAEVSELRKGLEKRQVNVRESLKHRLRIIEGRVSKMREVRDKKRDEGTDRARSFEEFNKLKKEYEAAQEAKDKLQIQYDVEKTRKAIPGKKKPAVQAPRPKPLPEETLTTAQPFSTFSLNVNDVSFKLARVSLLEKGEWPDAAKVRTEEFVNAFDYGDASPRQGEKVSCAVEQAVHPFLQQRNLLRIGMKTAAMGRSQPLRLTVLLDNSGSMERADREASVLAAMRVLADQLGKDDVVTVVGFARQPRLLADRVPGNQAGSLVDIVSRTPSEGGTNIEEALRLARKLAKRQHAEGAQSRVVLITDGVANLGNTVPEELANTIELMRQEGIAFDACGVGAEGLNDEILEALTRKGDGRYYFLNSPADADAGFAKQLAGALTPAAKNVKVQVVFNPNRVTRYRLLGFNKHRLNKEDFRNDKVDAAEMAAEESGNAVYQVEVNPQGQGELGEVFVRFLDVATGRMVERSWPLPFEPQAQPFDLAEPSMQLAGTAAMLGEKLHGTDAGSVRFSKLSTTLGKIQAHFAADARVQDLVRMCRKVK